MSPALIIVGTVATFFCLGSTCVFFTLRLNKQSDNFTEQKWLKPNCRKLLVEDCCTRDELDNCPENCKLHKKKIKYKATEVFEVINVAKPKSTPSREVVRCVSEGIHTNRPDQMQKEQEQSTSPEYIAEEINSSTIKQNEVHNHVLREVKKPNHDTCIKHAEIKNNIMYEKAYAEYFSINHLNVNISYDQSTEKPEKSKIRHAQKGHGRELDVNCPCEIENDGTGKDKHPYTNSKDKGEKSTCPCKYTSMCPCSSEEEHEHYSRRPHTHKKRRNDNKSYNQCPCQDVSTETENKFIATCPCSNTDVHTRRNMCPCRYVSNEKEKQNKTYGYPKEYNKHKRNHSHKKKPDGVCPCQDDKEVTRSRRKQKEKTTNILDTNTPEERAEKIEQMAKNLCAMFNKNNNSNKCDSDEWQSSIASIDSKAKPNNTTVRHAHKRKETELGVKCPCEDLKNEAGKVKCPCLDVVQDEASEKIQCPCRNVDNKEEKHTILVHINEPKTDRQHKKRYNNHDEVEKTGSENIVDNLTQNIKQTENKNIENVQTSVEKEHRDKNKHHHQKENDEEKDQKNRKKGHERRHDKKKVDIDKKIIETNK